MNTAFPDASVYGYEVIVSKLVLPDPNDRHVLAAGIRCNADVIVTKNLKHFPVAYLAQFDIEPQNPDSFVSNLIDMDEKLAMDALKAQVARLKNPLRTIPDVLETLESNGLVESVRSFRDLL